MTNDKTVFVNPSKVVRKWYIIDAKNQILGKVAVAAATLLRGKHKPEYTSHQAVGDYVIIINAKEVQVTGKKREQKVYYRHSGYPGSLKKECFEKVIHRKPTFPVMNAVRLMLPKNRLGRKLFSYLKVYENEIHSNEAQKPEIFKIT